MYVVFIGEGLRSRSYGRTVAIRLIVQSCDDAEEKEDYVLHFSKYWSTGEIKLTGEKPVPVPLCPPQIPHGLTRDRTWASAVRGWRLTA
jgi:hypothetical protein